MSLFPGFGSQRVAVDGVEIHAVVGPRREAPAVLLLHGYPQTHAIWHKVAPRLAGRFNVVATDLRGYGDSGKPPTSGDHAPYSKRVMAADQVAVMRRLGHERFAVVGHDRGARVAHRMAVDHAEAVTRITVLDIAPTLAMYENTTEAFARAYWHWFFLILPAPVPETMIGADPRFLLRAKVAAGSAGMKPFAPAAWDEYERCFTPEMIHASCEDYRAAASIDLVHDRADREAGRKVRCPLLALWGANGVIERCFRPWTNGAGWPKMCGAVPFRRATTCPKRFPTSWSKSWRPFSHEEAPRRRSRRRRHRQGGRSRRPARPRGRRAQVRLRARLGREALELRVLRQARRDDAQGRARLDPQARRDLPRRRGVPGSARPRVALGLLIPIRRGFRQYVNLRPVRLMPGVPSPLANRKPGDIDFWVVRENNEGEYSNAGGRMHEGTDQEMATQLSIFTRHGTDRIMRFAFELAKTRTKKHVTSATKSNGISITMPYWDERFKAISAEYPGIKTSQYHIDLLTAHFVQHPDWFDVVVGSNLFGDILSDLGPACTGTIGIAPSANLNPEREFPSCFEPVHGSAPDIYGKKIANPIGQIWSGAMMLEHLGHKDAGDAIVKAIERVLMEGPRTRDMGGTANTVEVGKAIADAL